MSRMIRSANSRMLVSHGLPRFTGPRRPSVFIRRTNPSTRTVVRQQMPHVLLAPGEEVIETDRLVPVRQKPLAKMGANEPTAARNQNAHPASSRRKPEQPQLPNPASASRTSADTANENQSPALPASPWPNRRSSSRSPAPNPGCRKPTGAGPTGALRLILMLREGGSGPNPPPGGKTHQTKPRNHRQGARLG